LSYLAELNEACAYAHECAPTLQEPWSVLLAIAVVTFAAMMLTGGEKA
jgi:hypothetical protein